MSHFGVGLWISPLWNVAIGEIGTACTTTVMGSAIYNAIGKRITDFLTSTDKVLKEVGNI